MIYNVFIMVYNVFIMVYNVFIMIYNVFLFQKRGLENSLSDAQHWHDMELQNMGSVVAKLEAELSDVRQDIEQQRRDYDTLLGNKLRLEQEIGLYHGILDGEESRFQPTPPPM